MKDAFTATVLAGTTESMISWENGIGKLHGGDGGADLSPVAFLPLLKCVAQLFVDPIELFIPCLRGYQRLMHPSYSERDAATFSCSVLIMSITCVMDTASSSVDGATELERIVLILPQQAQQLKDSKQTVKTPRIDCDIE